MQEPIWVTIMMIGLMIFGFIYKASKAERENKKIDFESNDFVFQCILTSNRWKYNLDQMSDDMSVILKLNQFDINLIEVYRGNAIKGTGLLGSIYNEEMSKYIQEADQNPYTEIYAELIDVYSIDKSKVMKIKVDLDTLGASRRSDQ